MEVLIKKQQAQRELLQKCILNTKKEPKEKRTKSYYERRLKQFEEHWLCFERQHKDILVLAYSDENFDHNKCTYFVTNVYDQQEEFFMTNVAWLEKNIEKLSLPAPVGQTNTSQIETSGTMREGSTVMSIKLPKLAIDKFRGDYKRWTTFHDLFKTMIHENRGYAPVQKLQYLKVLLEGEPEHLIRHLQISDDNYEPAWELLKERYDNKRVLINSQLDLLFNQPVLVTETAHNIRQLLDTTTECTLALKNLNVDVATWDPILVYLVVKRLPSATHQLWEQSSINRKELPSWKLLQEFLKTRFRTLEAVYPKRATANKTTTRGDQLTPHARAFHVTTNPPCPVCHQEHNIRQCAKFSSYEPKQKMEVVKANRLCINCLAGGHMAVNCSSTRKCRLCNRRHHSLLHNVTFEKRTQQSYSGTSTDTGPSQPIADVLAITTSDGPPLDHSCTKHHDEMTNLRSFIVNKTHVKHVLLATAWVKVVSQDGREQVVRAVIDPGSQLSFISESVKQNLQLKGEKINATLEVIGREELKCPKVRTEFFVKSLKNNNYSVKVTGLVWPKITDVTPVHVNGNLNWKHLQHLDLADPEYHLPGKIDLLLGADVHGKIIRPGVILGKHGSPTAQRTTLGWILSGEVTNHGQTNIRLQTFHLRSDLDSQLKRFWEIEEIPERTARTEEETECEELFQRTTTRSPTGRYEVCLPFKETTKNFHLGRSRNIAISRLLQMERRFAKDPRLQEDYSKCLEEYVELGHMKKVTTMEDEHRRDLTGTDVYSCSYLPHHGVIKETSTTTKLRVVFDASRQTESGVSVNDMLRKGPVIQDELTALLIRWRKHRIAFTADLEKMYRQVRVRNEDTEFQRIVWRPTPNHPIEDYKLSTVTFGTKSAPYLATRVVQQLALDEKEKYPKAAEIALSDFYVDDLLSGSHSIDEALVLQRELLQLMTAGGFSLRKWASNCKEMLQSIPESYCETNPFCELSCDEVIRTLGTIWNPATDTLAYTYKTDQAAIRWTKRTILSETSKLFDPLGLLTPIIIQAKLIIQALWLQGLGWDEAVPINLQREWLKYKESLLDIDKIKILRWTHYTTQNIKTEIHGFSDASTKAYAAAVYLCVEDKHGHRHSTLLAAKSRVAPLKTVTLPRLELCAATLLAKLMRYVISALKLEGQPTTYAWTDSEIVIAWLRGHPTKWKTFIANRVSYIHETLGSNIWHHVPSKQNPADCASRGMGPTELREHELWWDGPNWLRQSEEEWPKTKSTLDTELEHRKIINLHVTLDNENLEEKYSSLTKLLRVTAYCKRFIFNAQRPAAERRTTYLKNDELKIALQFWILQVQERHFSNEIKALRQQRALPRQSRLLKLSPFIDENNILRVGGRLQHSDLSFNEKFPIILPDKCHLTILIIEKAHRDTMHGGPQLMMQVLAQNYWILNARNTIRHRIHTCLSCYKQKATTQTQLMGQIPAVRLQATRPFTHAGVDYCGPFELKTHKGRNPKKYKAYIALFVCMVTKALHLEVVTDLSADGFIAAFRRFTSRRGLCAKLYCDCGTNFVGANRLLKRQQQRLGNQLNDEIGSMLENEGVSFNFIPPSSPHFGGLWEAGVKSTKYHIKRVISTTLLTYEEFTTILVQNEACLNSRPLMELSSDPREATALTPAHFLIGGALRAVPEPSLLDVQMNRLDRWQLMQRLVQNFWKRWTSEYLSRLQQRPKWLNTQANLIPGELVLLKEDNLPPSQWALGRIIEVYPGQDGLVRVVSVQIRDKVFKRPITKICKLPFQKTNDIPVKI